MVKMHRVILVVATKRIIKECIANKLIEQENNFKNYLITPKSSKKGGKRGRNDRINKKK